MIYNPTDRLDFGKYRGVQTGLVYLLAPGYIKWAIRDRPAFCLGELDFLSSLDVIDSFGKSSWEAHEAEIDVEIIKNQWSKIVDFEQVKFSGYKPFRLPDDILEMNQKKQQNLPPQRSREITPKEERFYFIYYPSEFLFSAETKFTPKELFTDRWNCDVINFEVDNYDGQIKFLPMERKLKVSSFFFEEWDITEEEVKRSIKNEEPFKGRIDNGFLQLST